MFKKILVPLTGAGTDRRSAALAFMVADRVRGHVEGLCVTPHAEVASPVETASIPAALGRKLREIAETRQSQLVESARLLFEDLDRRFGGPGTGRPTSSWRAEVGSLAEIIPEEARLADLTVFARDGGGADLIGAALEATLFDSGRPILLAPAMEPGAEPASFGTAVAVAWDGGLPASRAVASALPLLAAADRVIILTGEKPSNRRAGDPDRLAESLRWHGVNAECLRVTDDGRPLALALVAGAAECGCDLMVMGGYGHSRFRETVLGGVTRDILSTPPDLPILMAH
ncbi:universal stress protein (plasmid) [Skermanella mucosa]|uniref:universal stress protein n=1 Tax=Skermanella mucosa TaxID=1789672 RepID=UPI00192B0D5B|nr:universal stress protein [Skermanella mucosa]UEM24896.1 universal stress protein [Skermanella mucosa]